MRYQPIVVSAFVLSLMGACDREDPPAGPRSAAPAPPVADGPALFRPAACAGDGVASPKAGQVFEYRMLSADGSADTGAVRRQTIRRVVGDLVEYSEELAMRGMGVFPAEARQSRLGFLLTAFMTNSFRYDDAASRIEALQPGQSADVGMTESFGQEGPATNTARVTFVGCGVAEPVIEAAQGEQVRVYRLELPFSTAEGGKRFGQLIDTEFLISETRGWAVAEKQKGGVLVLTAARPS